MTGDAASLGSRDRSDSGVTARACDNGLWGDLAGSGGQSSLWDCLLGGVLSALIRA